MNWALYSNKQDTTLVNICTSYFPMLIVYIYISFADFLVQTLDSYIDGGCTDDNNSQLSSTPSPLVFPLTILPQAL